MARANKIKIERLLSDGIDNIDRAAAVLAEAPVNPQTVTELQEARNLIERAKERERRSRINMLTAVSL